MVGLPVYQGGSGGDGFSFMNDHPPALWLSADKSRCGSVGARDLEASSSQYFTLGTALNPGTSDFHVAFWIKPESLPSIAYLLHTGAAAAGLDGFLIYSPSASGMIKTILIDTDETGTGASCQTAVGTIVANKWHFVVLNYDRDGNCDIFIDDMTSASASADISSQQANLAGANKTVGAYSTGLYPWDGLLCRLSYGTELLTEADRAELYNQGNGKLYGELSSSLAAKVTHYWNGNEASGNLIDQAGSNDGTAVNAPLSSAGPRQSIAADSSGNDYHGVLTGFTDTVNCWVPNDIAGGYALRVADVGSMVITTKNTLSGEGARTVAMRIRGGAQPGTVYPFCEAAGSTTNRGFSAYFVSPNLYLGVVTGTAWAAISHTNGAAILDDDWHTIVFRWDGTTDASKVQTFVDGVLVHSATATATTQGGASTHVARIGQPGQSMLVDYDGVVVEAGRAWSDAEITAYHNSGTVPATATMNWTLNDGPQASGVVDGDPIASLESREGNRYLFNQATASSRPLWLANAANGQPGLDFDGADDYLLCANPILSGERGHIFLVAISHDTTTGYVFNAGDNTSATRRCGVMFTAAPRYYQRDDDTPEDMSALSASIGTTVHILEFTSNGELFGVTVDGVGQSLTFVTGSNNGDWFGDTSSLDNFAIGALAQNTVSSWKNCEVLELIAYDDCVLPDSVAEAIRSHLANKYGITLA